MLRGVSDCIDRILVDVLVRVDADGGGAGLTGVLSGTEGERVSHRLDVRVGKDERRGLATEFEVQALDAARFRGHYRLAGAGGAGEGDHRGVRVSDERCANIVAAGHHVQMSCGQSSFMGGFSQEGAGARGGGRGFENNRVACC